MVKLKFLDYFMVFMMIVCCGFPIGDKIPAKTFLIIAIGLLYVIQNPKKMSAFSAFYKPLLIMLTMIIVVLIAHYRIYGIFDNVLFQTTNISLAGFFVFLVLGSRFKYAYLIIMTFISAISILCFLSEILLNYIPTIELLYSGSVYKGIFLWTTRYGAEGRNCGPFWEPGAFSGYLLMVFVFYFSHLKELWEMHRLKVILISIALITTFSTQGYIGAFLLFMSYLIVSMKGKKTVKMLIAAFVIIISSSVIYESTSFLNEKVNEQIELSKDWTSDESLQSATRFTTTMVDLDIIGKNPIFGGSNDLRIKYKDFDYILYRIEMIGAYGSGSGITGYAASNGLVILLVWILLTYRALSTYYNDKKSAFFILLFLLALGQGEVYLNYMLYLSLPYLAIITPTKVIIYQKK